MIDKSQRWQVFAAVVLVAGLALGGVVVLETTVHAKGYIL
jgi:hypothetical protein